MERDDMEQRTCAACGEQFTPTRSTHPKQRACPPTDEDRALAKGQPRSKCARKLMNAAQRGRPVVIGKVGQPFDCEQCGKPCMPGSNVSPHATRFCRQLCKRAWHAEHEDGATRRHKREQQYADAVTRLLNITLEPSPLDIAAYKRALRRDPCAYCGTTESSLNPRRRSRGVDHIEPVCSGGADDWTNMTSCCHRCNSAKGDISLLAALLWLPVSRAYHDLRRVLWHAA